MKNIARGVILVNHVTWLQKLKKASMENNRRKFGDTTGK